MKLLAVLIALTGIVGAAPVFAESHDQPAHAVVSDTGAGGVADGSSSSGASGKTRAEVYAELIQAQKDGLVPVPRVQYPPSSELIRRNQELYRLTH
jgi:hypothetical protein